MRLVSILCQVPFVVSTFYYMPVLPLVTSYRTSYRTCERSEGPIWSDQRQYWHIVAGTYYILQTVPWNYIYEFYGLPKIFWYQRFNECVCPGTPILILLLPNPFISWQVDEGGYYWSLVFGIRINFLWMSLFLHWYIPMHMNHTHNRPYLSLYMHIALCCEYGSFVKVNWLGRWEGAILSSPLLFTEWSSIFIRFGVYVVMIEQSYIQHEYEHKLDSSLYEPMFTSAANCTTSKFNVQTASYYFNFKKDRFIGLLNRAYSGLSYRIN